MYVCSGIKGEIDKDTCREATKIAFSAHTFLENALRIFYVTVKILAARQSLLPTEYSGLHRAAQTAEGEEIIPAVAEKMF